MRTTLELFSGCTGAIFPSFSSTAPAGWILLNGATLGETGSGATHAGDGFKNLYILLWESLADAEAPVSSGRGGSASADWDAGKTLTIPDFRGRALIGAGAGSGLTARTIGTKGGAETHVLADTEIPAHSHNVKYSNQTYTSGAGTMVGTIGTGGLNADTDDNTGGGGAHNNMQPWGAVNFMVKL